MKHYIDSNVFIYPIIAEAKTEIKSASAKRTLLQIATGELKDDATSCLTWDDLVWVLTRFLGKKIALSQGKRFLSFQNLHFVDVKQTTIDRAQDLIENYDLKPRDAIHAACALENGIQEIISDDPDFDRVEELKRIKL